MSEADREKWERRYAEGEYAGRDWPTRLLADWLERPDGPSWPDRPSALDLACGAGRNALYLAGRGFEVDAMDISTVALARAEARAAEMGVRVNWMPVDLDEATIDPERYDLVIIARYVNRGLTEALTASLREGGYLVYEQHLVTDRDVGGPRNPAFCVQPNELLRMFSSLRVLEYREGIVTDPGGATMALAQLVACRGSGGF